MPSAHACLYKCVRTRVKDVGGLFGIHRQYWVKDFRESVTTGLRPFFVKVAIKTVYLSGINRHDLALLIVGKHATKVELKPRNNLPVSQVEFPF